MLRSLEIRGELSNVKYHSSGHVYFTLKDGKAAISGVMFATEAYALSFRIENGMQVIVSGGISVYEKAGTYQIYARSIRREGSGELYERFLKLKQELEDMGMFAAEYKQPIPKYIRRLGVVTASTGAAIRDIINVSRRRDPFIEIFLYPAKVQGEGAAESVAEGIRTLDRFGVDTIIVGRGGGSIEDLWAFNEEITARAIFDCETPVISAVGHETDTTIADFTADLRAPTPSAAAELAVFDYSAFTGELAEYRLALLSGIDRRIRAGRQQVENLSLRLERMHPGAVIREKRLRLDRLESDLITALAAKLERKKAKAALYEERLKRLSPQEKLSAGYAYVKGPEGRPVTDAGGVQPGDRLTLVMRNGRIEADVAKVEKTGSGTGADDRRVI